MTCYAAPAGSWSARPSRALSSFTPLMLYEQAEFYAGGCVVAVDVAAITGAIVARLKTDAAGVSVRAALGAGADSIMHAERLKQFTQDRPMPARPVLAYRGGGVGGHSYEMRPVTLTWWIYDDAGQRYTRINALLPLIERAYPFDCVPFGRIETALIGQETTDPVLGLVVRTLQLAFYTRG